MMKHSFRWWKQTRREAALQTVSLVWLILKWHNLHCGLPGLFVLPPCINRIAVAGVIMFLGCTSIHTVLLNAISWCPIPVNAISQKSMIGISSNLMQMSTEKSKFNDIPFFWLPYLRSALKEFSHIWHKHWLQLNDMVWVVKGQLNSDVIIFCKKNSVRYSMPYPRNRDWCVEAYNRNAVILMFLSCVYYLRT